MITRNMVEQAYDDGIVKLETSGGDGIVCRIGDNTFFFGGVEAEECGSVDKFVRDNFKSCIVDDIFKVLCEFKFDFAEEYLYYKFFLKENGYNN